jgi:hypothetical protein
MKNKFRNIALISVLTLMFSTISSFSQTRVEKKQIKVITEFYSVFNSVISDSQSKSNDVLIAQCDSLLDKYCTTRIKNDVSQWMKNRQSKVSEYWKLNTELLNTLKIIKYGEKPYSFLVSYEIPGSGKLSKKAKKQIVKVVITLKEENGIYKIDEVS